MIEIKEPPFQTIRALCSNIDRCSVLCYEFNWDEVLLNECLRFKSIRLAQSKPEETIATDEFKSIGKVKDLVSAVLMLITPLPTGETWVIRTASRKKDGRGSIGGRIQHYPRLLVNWKWSPASVNMNKHSSPKRTFTLLVKLFSLTDRGARGCITVCRTAIVATDGFILVQSYWKEVRYTKVKWSLHNYCYDYYVHCPRGWIEHQICLGDGTVRLLTLQSPKLIITRFSWHWASLGWFLPLRPIILLSNLNWQLIARSFSGHR